MPTVRELWNPPDDMECPSCGKARFCWADKSLGGFVKLFAARLFASLARRLVFLRLRCKNCKKIIPHLHVLPRTVVGYHGCHHDFARDLIAGKVSTQAWRQSENNYDWLGKGIYFWEHAPGRAWQWARKQHRHHPAVVAAEIHLGRCLDLADTAFTDLLRQVYQDTKTQYEHERRPLPNNKGKELKLRELDRLIIDRLTESTDEPDRLEYQTVRCPFEEGEAVYDGGMFKSQSHVQIAVRDRTCIAANLFLVDPEGA